MKVIDKICRIVERPERLVIGIQLRWTHLTDNQELLIKALYNLHMEQKLNLNNPKTFMEKVQWLKLNDHNPLYHKLVDKYEVKKYVADKIGDKYIIHTLGIWNSFDEIDFDNLPDKFVLKTTNGGGSTGVVICTDKMSLDKEKAKMKLERSMKNDIYKGMGEWAYKGLKPRIMAETFMSSAKSSIHKELSDYKFFCFNGEPIYCQVIRDRSTKETIDFYDMEWNHQEFVGLNPAACNGSFVERPVHLVGIHDICRKLSKDIPFVRVDLYIIDDKEYFGELTFYPASGYGVITLEIWQWKLGDILKLPSGGGKCLIDNLLCCAMAA